MLTTLQSILIAFLGKRMEELAAGDQDCRSYALALLGNDEVRSFEFSNTTINLIPADPDEFQQIRASDEGAEGKLLDRTITLLIQDPISQEVLAELYVSGLSSVCLESIVFWNN